MEQKFLPVWTHSHVSGLSKTLGTDMAWWSEPPLRYGHALLSYVYWKRPYTFPEGCYIFGDSGGFSLLSKKKAHRIDPVDVLRWQMSMATVGVVLDLPPRGGDRRDWHGCLQVTAEHVRRALPTYLKAREAGHKFRWWGAMQGNNEDEVRAWHKVIADIYPFTEEGEGWAIFPGPRANPYSVARSLRILKSLEITRAHFLMCTAQEVTASILALSERSHMEFVSYDSAYALKYGFNRGMFVPTDDGLMFNVPMERTLEDRFNRDRALSCECPMCERMRVRSEEDPKGRAEVNLVKFGGWWSAWLQLHNVHAQRTVLDKQAALAAKDPEALLALLLSRPERTRLLRVLEEDGHEPTTQAAGSTTTSLLDYIK